jgi:hypothetical protein
VLIAALALWLVFGGDDPEPAPPAASSGPAVTEAQLKRAGTNGCRSGAEDFTGRVPSEVVATDVARVAGDLWEVTCVTDIDKLRLRATVQGKPDGSVALWRVEVIERAREDRARGSAKDREPFGRKLP